MATAIFTELSANESTTYDSSKDQQFTRVPLSDGVGIVTATGNGVSRVKVGDRVAPIFYPKWLEGRVASEKMGQALGGAAVINYKVKPDWPRAVVELTDGVGADHVVDTVGGLKEAIAAVRLGGTVAFVGLLIGMTSEVDLVTFMGKCARVEAVDVGSRAMFEAMNKAIEFHGMHPVVDRVFEFNELGEALEYLREARHFGKVCLRA